MYSLMSFDSIVRSSPSSSIYWNSSCPGKSWQRLTIRASWRSLTSIVCSLPLLPRNGNEPSLLQLPRDGCALSSGHTSHSLWHILRCPRESASHPASAQLSPPPSHTANPINSGHGQPVRELPARYDQRRLAYRTLSRHALLANADDSDTACAPSRRARLPVYARVDWRKSTRSSRKAECPAS